MRKVIIILMVLLLVGAGAYVAFARFGGQAVAQEAPAPAPTLAPIQASGTIIADGEVVPLASVELNFDNSGRVAEVLVQEGATVAAGAPLARLDTRDLELGIAQAEAELLQTKADLTDLTDGATPEEIAEAQARIAESQGQLRSAQGSVTAADIAAAQQQLTAALARLTELEAGAKPTDVQSARAVLDKARAQLDEQRHDLSAAKTTAEANVHQAALTLQDKQAEFSRIHWDNEKWNGDTLPQEMIDKEEAAKRAVADAEQELKKGQVAFEQAKQAEITGIASAEADVQDAQAALDKLLAGSDKDKLADARADVADARARLTELRSDKHAGEVASAQAGVAQSEAALAQLQSDPSASALAKAQAAVQLAEVNMKKTQVALDKATLKAPIAGTIAQLNLKAGEVPSTTKAAVILADTSIMQIETTDLTELSIVPIKVGAQATITFDAIPGFELLGTVTKIKPIGANKQGDIVYTVVVTPKHQDARLLWKMTASVAIQPGE